MPLDSSAFAKSVVLGTIAVVGLMVLAQLPCIGFIFSLSILAAYMAIGASYGHFTRANGFKVEVTTTGFYGAMAAAAASLVPVLISEFFTSGIVDFVICTPVVLLIGAIFSGVLGGIGGAIYGALAD